MQRKQRSFYKERKRTRERCILLKRTQKNACPTLASLQPVHNWRPSSCSLQPVHSWRSSSFQSVHNWGPSSCSSQPSSWRLAGIFLTAWSQLAAIFLLFTRSLFCPVIFFSFFLPQVEVFLSTLRFYSITQWSSCSAPGSLWGMPDLNPGPLTQKSGALPMSHHISLWGQKLFIGSPCVVQPFFGQATDNLKEHFYEKDY